MGGLIELCRNKTMLYNIINNAIKKLSKCSSDPICSKHKKACESCLFIPEISCSYKNKYLNREYITKTSGSDNDYAFFK